MLDLEIHIRHDAIFCFGIGLSLFYSFNLQLLEQQHPFLHTLGTMKLHSRICAERWHESVNTLGLKQNCRHFADIFECVFLKENAWTSLKTSLKFVSKVLIYNILALIQIMAWHRPGAKQLSRPMVVSSLTHISDALIRHSVSMS